MTDDRSELAEMLLAACQLLARPDNNFDWSSWEDCSAAISEIDRLLEKLKNDDLPSYSAVSVLFLPTGPMQEVALSSGWGDEFETLASRFNEVEKRLWR